MASDKTSWCVYVHISPSGKYYVGITSQKNPNGRWRNGDGYKYNQHFTRAIQKYGWDNFQHEIVASNLFEAEAKNFEKLLIKKLHANDGAYGYNISSGGDGATGIHRYGAANSFFGKHHTEESRRKMSISRSGKIGSANNFYGRHHSAETRLLLSINNGTPVCQFDTDLNFIKEYRSANQASEENGIYLSMIIGCCNMSKGYVTAGGYVWLRKEDVSVENIALCSERLNHDKLPKPVCQFTKEMEYITTFDSIASAANKCGLSSPDISNAINGKVQTCGGYIWIALSEYESMLSGEKEMRKPFVNPQWKEICKFSLDGKFIEKYPTRKIAGDSVGVTPQAIGYACRSESHICKGYKWLFSSNIDNEVA